ncbi:MAG: hypothetical protein IIY16_02940 [Oscillospiraceae bacterium]|nr:hypothetical protein [Oscillospiraceae bacterium]
MDDFTKELLKFAAEAEKLGCRMSKLKKDAEQYGGVQTAKEYLRKDRLSDGFDLLADQGALKYSMEALVVKGKYGALFTDEEVNRCFERLCDAGFYTVTR